MLAVAGSAHSLTFILANFIVVLIVVYLPPPCTAPALSLKAGQAVLRNMRRPPRVTLAPLITSGTRAESLVSSPLASPLLPPANAIQRHTNTESPGSSPLASSLLPPANATRRHTNAELATEIKDVRSNIEDIEDKEPMRARAPSHLNSWAYARAEPRQFVTTAYTPALTQIPSLPQNLDVTPLLKAALPIIFFMGDPGTGKGTQCEETRKKYNFCHLSTGDILRRESKTKTPEGRYLAGMMNIAHSGGFLPDQVVLPFLLKEMLGQLNAGCKGWLIDGFPRKVEQLRDLVGAIGKPSMAVTLEVDDEEKLVQRLVKRGQISGRLDDTEVTIRERLRQSKQFSAPVIKELQGMQCKVARITADASVPAVFAQVCSHVDSLPNIPKK